VRHFSGIELDPTSAIDYANLASTIKRWGTRPKPNITIGGPLKLDPRIEFAARACPVGTITLHAFRKEAWSPGNVPFQSSESLTDPPAACIHIR